MFYEELSKYLYLHKFTVQYKINYNTHSLQEKKYFYVYNIQRVNLNNIHYFGHTMYRDATGY